MKKYSSTTKVNYHHTLRKKRQLWFGVAVVLIVVGLLLPWLVSKVATIALYPIHATAAWVKNSDGVIPTYFRSKADLVSELEALRTKVATETETKLSVDRLLEENMKLRALTNVSTSSKRVVARVMASPNSLVYDSLQIDQGSQSGLEVGMPVYSGLDTVVGMVLHVTPKYSFVELFTAPNFEATAFIVGPNVFGVIEGMGGGVSRVRLPQGISLHEGQLVLLPAVFSGVYGEIAWVENHPTQPEQYGYVVPPLSINNIFYVSVDTEVVQPKTEAVIEAEIRAEIQNKARLQSPIIDSLNSRLADEFSTTTAATTTEEIIE